MNQTVVIRPVSPNPGSSMNYRERFLNVLRGRPVDRLPFVEHAQYDHAMLLSDWKNYVTKAAAVRRMFDFDNNSVPSKAVKGTAGNILPPDVFESVPVEYAAVPRFEERALPSEDGYPRRIDRRYRILPCLTGNLLLPETPFKHYQHYVQYLRAKI